jgi:hypothetical protein
MRAPLKIVEPTLDGRREELRLAILDVEAAEVASAKSQALVSSAEDHLRGMRVAHGRATSALEDARAVQRPLADRLAEADSDDERFRVIDEHNASTGRPAITADDLRKLRQACEAADDEVVAAQSALDLAHDQARPAASALNRAKERRQHAVYEISRQEIGRLMREAQDLVERLGAKRAELRFVAWNLLDPYRHADDRRRAESFLSRPAYPEESGLMTENDPTRRNGAIAAWQAFATQITADATTPCPE